MAGKARFSWTVSEEWKSCARLWFSCTRAKWRRTKVSPLPAMGEPTITITVNNSLPAPGFSTAALHNQFKTFDITNLHTHGLHVSSNAPGDDVRRSDSDPRP